MLSPGTGTQTASSQRSRMLAGEQGMTEQLFGSYRSRDAHPECGDPHCDVLGGGTAGGLGSAHGAPMSGGRSRMLSLARQCRRSRYYSHLILSGFAPWCSGYARVATERSRESVDEVARVWRHSMLHATCGKPRPGSGLVAALRFWCAQAMAEAFSTPGRPSAEESIPVTSRSARWGTDQTKRPNAATNRSTPPSDAYSQDMQAENVLR